MKNKKQFMLVQMALPEVLEAIKKIFQKYQPKIKADSKDVYFDLPDFVTGIKDAARVLGVAPSTIARWKKSGGYDDCIFQDERSCGLIRTRCWRRCVQATRRVSMEKLCRIK